MNWNSLTRSERDSLRSICRSVNRQEYPAVVAITLETVSLQCQGLCERVSGRWRATNAGMELHTSQRILELL